MGETQDLGRRVELVPMDGHFHDISIGLYRRDSDGGPAFLVHTYSKKKGVRDRIRFVRETMKEMGGVEDAGDGYLRFACGNDHERACRRLFLESVKQDPSEPVAARPLETIDKRSGLTIHVTSGGDGTFTVSAEGESDDRERRIATIAGGMAKLGDLEWDEDSNPDNVRFSCGHDHILLAGLLLVRAPNVRAVLREERSAASRGVLAAPSQQKEG